MISSWNRGQAAALTAASSLGRAQAANDRIRIGVIGTGGKGQSHIRNLKTLPGNEVVAVCDVYPVRLEQARALTDNKAEGYNDYRRVLERKDVDAVMIVAPDHHHRDMFIDAIKAGKDVYQEKPLSRTIEEGQEMVKAAKAGKQVVQAGSQKRSADQWMKGKEIIDSGRLGKITMVRVWDLRTWVLRDPYAPPAEMKGEVDWNRFLGRAPKVPFDPHRYFAWRWFWDYAGGLITDIGAHQVDAMQWLMGVDAPLSVVCHGGVYHFDYWQTPDIVHQLIDYGKFSGQVTYDFQNSHEGEGGRFYGTKGTLEIVGRNLRLFPQPVEVGVRVDTSKPEFEYQGGNDVMAHLQNWLDCIRSRKTPNAPIEVAHKSITTAHLGNIAYKQGKKVNWDAAREKIV